jgi:hypothetical protein
MVKFKVAFVGFTLTLYKRACPHIRNTRARRVLGLAY